MSLQFSLFIGAGNLTSDIELKSTSNGTHVANFTVAMNLGYKENKSTLFINCRAWGNKADFVANYFSKGMPIFIEGELKQDRWKDSTTGQMRSAYKVEVANAKFVVGKEEDSGSGGEYVPAAVANRGIGVSAADFEDLPGGEDSDLPF